MPINQLDLSGRVAVVTGAGGALGGSAARYLAKQDVKVICLGRTLSKLEVTAAEIKNNGGEALVFEADVLNRDALTTVKESILNEYGRIDMLINAAGGNTMRAVVGPDQSVFDLSMDYLQEVTDLNLNGCIIPTLVFGEEMAKKGKGSIVTYSSMSVDRVITRSVGYSASKAAMENFTKWMAVELAKKYGEGIRVNAIAPGFFIGDQNRSLLINPDGSLTNRGELIIKNTPFGRFGEADELNGAIHWLCSDAASFVTGVSVPIDGGFSVFSGV